MILEIHNNHRKLQKTVQNCFQDIISRCKISINILCYISQSIGKWMYSNIGSHL